MYHHKKTVTILSATQIEETNCLLEDALERYSFVRKLFTANGSLSDKVGVPGSLFVVSDESSSVSE